MPHILQQLLAAREPTFSLALNQLEQASGHRAYDARLVGDIAAKLTGFIRQLGLDPNDTTGRELYAALIARIQSDNLRVARLLGGNDPDDVKAMAPLIIKKFESMNLPRQAWLLKKTVAKRHLANLPPKNLMKVLGYRSVESFLKHERIEELYIGLRFSETTAWLDKFNQQMKTVRPSDFETREIKIIQLDGDKYQRLAMPFVAKKLHNVTHSKELGVVGVLPTEMTQIRGVTLVILPLLLHYLNEIKLYAAFFKLRQVKPDFGKVVVEALNADPANAGEMAGLKIHWRVIQRHYAKLREDSQHPEIFEPHVQPEDLHWQHTLELMGDIDPGLRIWRDLEYVGKIFDDRPLTCNFMDVSLSYSHNMSYGQQYIYHFRDSLWNEIFTRYMGSRTLEKQVLKRLDNDVISPE